MEIFIVNAHFYGNADMGAYSEIIGTYSTLELARAAIDEVSNWVEPDKSSHGEPYYIYSAWYFYIIPALLDSHIVNKPV